MQFNFPNDFTKDDFDKFMEGEHVFDLETEKKIESTKIKVETKEKSKPQNPIFRAPTSYYSKERVKTKLVKTEPKTVKLEPKTPTPVKRVKKE